MSKYLLTFMCLILSSCTYNISMAHTQGRATDVIDSTQSAKATPTISVPVQSTGSGQTVTLPPEVK